MKVKAVVQVPAGQHVGEFAGCETTEHKEYGPGLLWSFKVTKGKWTGQKVGRTTTDKASKKNNAGKFLTMLTGLSFENAIKADTDDFIGTECRLIVAETDSGFTRVESFIPVRDPGEDDINDRLADAADGEDAQDDN